MTASATLAQHVAEAVHGRARHDGLAFLRNFHGCLDGAAVTAAPTAASASTKMFVDSRNLASGAAEDLDLSGGVATLTKVHAIYVRCASTNAAGVKLGGAAANGFKGPFADLTDIVVVSPGEELLITSKAGWPVTAATADILHVANAGAAAAEYDIVICGE